jgi:hypothetical protein
MADGSEGGWQNRNNGGQESNGNRADAEHRPSDADATDSSDGTFGADGPDGPDDSDQ